MGKVMRSESTVFLMQNQSLRCMLSPQLCISLTCLAVGDLHTDFENISSPYFSKGGFTFAKELKGYVSLITQLVAYYDQYESLPLITWGQHETIKLY